MAGFIVPLDQFDREASAEGNAIREFRNKFGMNRPDTKAESKRGVLRGIHGAKQRTGLLKIGK